MPPFLRKPRLTAALCGAAALLSSACIADGAEPARPAAAVSPAPRAVEVIYGEWTDAARGGRAVPYKLYLPEGTGPFPLIVHSHGLGGSREGSTFILEAVARAGFVVVALQHPGSDTSIVGGILRGRPEQSMAAMPADAAENRFRDLPFALDQLAAANAAGPLKGKLDLTRIGMSGHSFGALSTLVALGQRLPGEPPGLREPRIRAAIVYSPNKARQGDQKTVFDAIATPILHFTGTEDQTPLDLEKTPWGRTTPFQEIGGADQFLLVLREGDHGIYSGRRQAMGRPKATDAAHAALIVDMTILFWRAYLRDDAAAAAALCGLPTAAPGIADGYLKAPRCGPPTPIAPAE